MSEIFDFMFANYWLFGLMGVLVISWRVAENYLSIRAVNVQKLVRLLNDKQAVVVDVRTQKEFVANHIAKAEHVMVEKLQSYCKTLNAKNKMVVLVCASGMTARGLGNKVRKDVPQIHYLDGGMAAWLEAKLPVTK